MIDWLFTLHDQPWFRLIELMIGLWILLYGITRERDEPEDVSRMDSIEQDETPARVVNIRDFAEGKR